MRINQHGEIFERGPRFVGKLIEIERKLHFQSINNPIFDLEDLKEIIKMMEDENVPRTKLSRSGN